MKKEISKATEILLCVLTITAAILIAFLPENNALATDVQSKTEICDIVQSGAANEMLELVNSGIIPVYEKGGKSYCLPDEEITREYIAVAMIKFLNVDASKYKNIEISLIDAEDIDKNNMPYIKAALSLGIMPAYSDKVGNYNIVSFCPDKSVTRQEAAGIVGSIISGTLASSKTAEFIDMSEVSDIYIDSVEKLIALSIMQGYDDNTFRPDNNITIKEFAVMLYKLKHSAYLQS